MNESIKTCAQCKEPKALDYFGLETRSADGRNPRCKSCVNDYQSKWRAKNPHGKNRRTTAGKLTKMIAMQSEYTRLRLEVIAAYGGECVCCGESAHEFLSIDHIYNDGALERNSPGGSSRGHGLYRRLKREGFPRDRYQLLCYNCNYAKSRYGVCPHQRGKEIPQNLKGVFRSPLRAESTDLVM